MGGGMPIGLIGINKDVYSRLKKKKIFFGGNIPVTHCLLMLGKNLDYIIKNKKIFQSLEIKSNKFILELNKFVKENKIDAGNKISLNY